MYKYIYVHICTSFSVTLSEEKTKYISNHRIFTRISGIFSACSLCTHPRPALCNIPLYRQNRTFWNFYIDISHLLLYHKLHKVPFKSSFYFQFVYSSSRNTRDFSRGIRAQDPRAGLEQAHSNDQRKFPWPVPADTVLQREYLHRHRHEILLCFRRMRPSGV